MSDSRYYYLCAIAFMAVSAASDGAAYWICAAGSFGYLLAAFRASNKESK